MPLTGIVQQSRKRALKFSRFGLGEAETSVTQLAVVSGVVDSHRAILASREHSGAPNAWGQRPRMSLRTGWLRVAVSRQNPRIATKIYLAALREGLTELASEELQRQLWLSSDGRGVSSFDEAVSRTYDDSGLSVALEKGDAAERLAPQAVECLQQLRRALQSVDRSLAVEKLIASKGMTTVREVAKSALDAM